MKVRIGAQVEEQVEVHPVEVLEKETFLAATQRPNSEGDLEWVPAVQFTVATGQGTSPEVIPLDEYPQYVATLREIHDDGVPRKVTRTKAYRPSFEVLREEMYQGDYTTPVKDANGKVVKGETNNHGERIFFRSATGQGRKTQKVRPEQMGEVIDRLEQEIDQLPAYQAYWDSTLYPKVLAKAQADAEKAAEKAAREAAKASSQG